MPKARFVQRAESVDFTPNRDIESGEVVRLGNLIGVAKLPIQAGELGTLALSGVFDLPKPVGLSFPVGSAVYWNSGALSPSGGVLLGLAVKSAPGESSSIRILLNYNGNDSATDDGGEWQSL